MKYTPLPASLSGEIVERLIRVDKSLLYLIAGALEFVADREPYDETGALTVDQVRTALGEMIWSYYTEEVTIMPIGAIQFFGVDTPPDKWLECNGDVVPIATYPKLFDAIGTNFGGSAGGNFTLPDLRYRNPLGLGELSSDPSFEIAIGQQAGQEVIALGINELPSHNHTISDPGHVHPPLSPSTNFVTSGSGSNTAAAGSQLPLRATTGSATTGISINNRGDGNPFPLIQPGLGLLACIYAGE
jgi:microcystin-dependent protein